MLYITNTYNYFFKVDEQDINVADLKDCTIHETEEAMYAHVCAACGLELDEVEGSAILVTKTQASAPNDCMYDFEEASAAEYINTFIL